MDKLTYTVNEGAAVVGVHHVTLRKAIERGDLRVVRVGRRILIPKSALDAFLEGEARPVAAAGTD